MIVIRISQIMRETMLNPVGRMKQLHIDCITEKTSLSTP